MTPMQLKLCAEVYNENFELERERKQQEMYVSALLISNFVWSKKRPTYEQVFKKQQQAMTDEQIFEMVKGLNAVLGGTDERGDKIASS